MTVLMVLRRLTLLTLVAFQFPLPLRAGKTKRQATPIVFLSNRAGVSRSFDLFLGEATSRSVRNITGGLPGAGLTSISAPVLLPKRNSIICYASGGKTIAEFPVGQDTMRTLASITQASGRLTPSPDGQAILYVDRIGRNLQIIELDLERGTARNLSSNSWNNSEPSYSPDGSRITYVTDEDGSLSIALMHRDGNGQKILTNDFGDDRHPRFSPAGDRIVFSSSRSGRHEGQFDLYTIDTLGGNFSLLYTNGASNTSPVFLPDAKRVLFVSTELVRKVSCLYLLNVDTRSVTNLTAQLPLFSQNPSLSNDGRFLVFEHNTVRDCEVMVYDMKEATMRNLTRNPAWDCSPSF